eukprot:gnl/MRDRNA2_/MRDRNA2_92440_c0_seq1.p1 gnl/MRDRNA2_/MRDRNA2_92440_c0~~gnl/MRDRNA2_/MRDRNA2_92440_c0_seq1.p1  ORF type:complete len:238 (+),score=67.50 gnl/MRDRNA2_/MRDRNA2_92440_c0_seq1:65-778(+)
MGGQQTNCCRPETRNDFDNLVADPSTVESITANDEELESMYQLDDKMRLQREKNEQELKLREEAEKKKREHAEKRHQEEQLKKKQRQELVEEAQKEREEKNKRREMDAALSIFQGLWTEETVVDSPKKGRKGKPEKAILDVASIKGDRLTWAPRFEGSQPTELKLGPGGSLVVAWHDGTENSATLEGSLTDPLYRRLRWGDGSIWLHKKEVAIGEVPVIVVPEKVIKGITVHEYDRK